MAGRFSVEAIFSAVDRVTGPVRRMQSALGGLTRTIERNLRSVTALTNSTVKSLASVSTSIFKFGAAGVGVITGAVALLTREFSKIEDAEAAFTPLMGGAERARQLVEALNETAASTPFQFEHLTGAVGQLLPVMNGDIERTIATLRKLGDTAGGNAQKLDSITRGFTKAMLKGKVDMESLNMIAEAGVPIFDDLAAVMGKKVNAAFFKMISSGQVTTKQLEAAFDRLTSKGGKFFQGMEIASRTTSGMWSTLMDNISLTAAELGSVLAPTVKEVIQALTDVAQRARDWVKANRDLLQSRVNEYVARIRSAVVSLIDWLVDLNRRQSILDRIANGFRLVGDGVQWMVNHGEEVLTLTKWVAGLVIGLNALVAVMTLVNLVMTANPIGLIVVGLIAAVAAVAAMIAHVDELVAMLESAPQWARVLLAPLELILRVVKLIKDNWEGIVGGGKKVLGWLGFDVGKAASPAADVPGVSQFTGGVLQAPSPVVNVASPVPQVLQAPSPVVNVASPVPQVLQVPSPVVNVASPVPQVLQAAPFTDPAANDEPPPAPRMVSPQERTARSIEERRTVNSAEVTLRDETGRAEVTRGKLSSNIKLQSTGRF